MQAGLKQGAVQQCSERDVLGMRESDFADTLHDQRIGLNC
jgi:hypothetical protein